MVTSWQFTPYIIPLLIAFALSLSLAIYAWQHRATLGTLDFIFLMLAVGEWALGYAMEIGSTDLAEKVFWGKVQYLGIVGAPVAWLTFAFRYTNRARWLTRRYIVLILIIPIMTLLFMWTDELTHLIWQQTTLETTGPFPALKLSYGPWFWVNWVCAQAYMIIGSILLINMMRRSAHLYRWQSVMLLFIALAPWIGNGTYVLRLIPVPNLDLTPFAFALSGLAMMWTFYRFHLLDVVPVARRAIVDNLPEAVIVLDIQDRIVDINPAVSDILGIDGTRAIGKPYVDALSPWPELVREISEIQEGQTDLILPGLDNPLRSYDVRISALFDQSQRFSGRLILLHDMTERKQTEEALSQARDHALEASRLKSDLLAKVSHELRTPLGVILGYTELMQAGVYEPLTDNQQQVTEDVIASARHLAKMVDELLDQAQFESGRVSLDKSPFNIMNLVQETEAQTRLLAERKGLTLNFQVSGDLPMMLLGDQRRLRQIMVNLIANAIKFTDKGSVDIALDRTNDTQWTITVSDTGLGIPEEAQRFIFEPFRQANGSITREHSGAGLGLSIVKQLTTIMEGEVSLESEIGRGSKFIILLPLYEGACDTSEY